MRFFAFFIVLTLALASCGFSSEALAACESPNADEPPPVDISSDLVSLNFDAEVYQPGDLANFSWKIADIEDPEMLFAGDSFVVQCWDGTNWNPAWKAIDIYGPEPSVERIEENRDSILEGIPVNDGAAAIPDATPSGWYRVVTQVRSDIDLESRFMVQAES